MPPASDLLAQLDAQADEMLALEESAATAASSEVRSRLNELARDVTTQWIVVVGSLTAVATAAQLAALLPRFLKFLNRVPPDRSDYLRRAARQGLLMGMRHGAAQLGEKKLETPVPHLPPVVERIIELSPLRVVDAVTKASREIQTAQSFPELAQALKTAQQAVHRIEADTRWVVNRSAAEGVTAVADHHGTLLVWRAERDACLRCLAYAGSIRGLSGFDPVEIFDNKAHGTIENPPEHPNCRCQIVAWNGVDSGGLGEPLPAALAREARRTVVKGWALPTESQTARRRAADQLLTRGARLPKTVESRARSAVRSKRRFTKPAP